MPRVAQRAGRGIALLFHDRGTRRRWVVSSTPRPHFTPGKEPVPIVQEAGWAPGPVWTGEKSRSHRDSIPDRQARSHSLYWLSYPALFNVYRGYFLGIQQSGGAVGLSPPFNIEVRNEWIYMSSHSHAFMVRTVTISPYFESLRNWYSLFWMWHSLQRRSHFHSAVVV